jgi:hypothetical protein
MLSRPDGYLEVFFVVLEVVPALLLVLTKSRHLLTYVVCLWAFGPEVRRISDWIYGDYQYVSLLSVTPLLCALSLIVPIGRVLKFMPADAKTAFKCLCGALAYGTLVGVIHNGLGAAYDLLSNVSPLLVLVYLISEPMSLRERDGIYRALSAIAVAVSLYCWVQFLLVPPWDALWMENCGMGSIGHPLPLQIRPWSTLNAPGPCAAFLGCALAPMILEKRWRGVLGWAGVVLVASALAITFVRTSYITLFVMVVAYISLSSGKSKIKTGISMLAVVAALAVITPHLPGGDRISGRLASMGDLSHDSSFQARSKFSLGALRIVFENPLGKGLGAVGGGAKLSDDNSDQSSVVFDNGYLAIALTFGPIGSLLVFASFYFIGRSAWMTQMKYQDPYSRLALAGLAGLGLALSSGNVLPGVSGTLFWMLISATFAIQSAAIEQVALSPQKSLVRA